MNCGEPHDTDCASVLEHVYEYIDHEMADDDLATVKEHLEDCSPCLAEYGLEQAVKALVHRCCSETAPEDLRAKVLAKIRKVQEGSADECHGAGQDKAEHASAARQTPALS
jgi:anti-sigma factor (TIGR02949 family)